MSDKLLKFPCDFPIKIIGDYAPEFYNEIKTIIKKHFADTKEITCKSSKEDKYLAITAIVHAKDQESLDKLYMDLTAHKSIKMVL